MQPLITPEFLISSIIFAFILLFIYALKKAKEGRKCAVCTLDTHDLFRDAEDKEVFLCKKHNIERWEKEVLASTDHMIVFEPNFKDMPFAYLYADLKQMEKWEYRKDDIAILSNYLDAIQGKNCAECTDHTINGTVAFFQEKDFTWPHFSKVNTVPTYLCKMHMVKKIKPLLQSNIEPLSEGLYAPTGKPGIYHAQEF